MYWPYSKNSVAAEEQSATCSHFQCNQTEFHGQPNYFQLSWHPALGSAPFGDLQQVLPSSWRIWVSVSLSFCLYSQFSLSIQFCDLGHCYACQAGGLWNVGKLDTCDFVLGGGRVWLLPNGIMSFKKVRLVCTPLFVSSNQAAMWDCVPQIFFMVTVHHTHRTKVPVPKWMDKPKKLKKIFAPAWLVTCTGAPLHMFTRLGADIPVLVWSPCWSDRSRCYLQCCHMGVISHFHEPLCP